MKRGPASTTAIPSPDTVQIERTFNVQFEAAERLLTTVWACAPRAPTEDVQGTLMNLLGRGIGTYRAILALLRSGLITQAWMLNRSLFEDLVVAYWFALPDNRETAVELITTHSEKTDERIDTLVARVSSEGIEAFSHVLPEEVWGGRGSVVPRGIDKMIDEIEDLWEELGGSGDELRAHNMVTHWFSNLELHVSGSSLTRTMMRGAVRLGSKRVYAYGQSSQIEEEQTLWAIEAAAFRLGFLARLVLIESGRALDDLEASYAALKRAVKELTPSMLRKWERNAPCWCGSGLKFKKCHGQ